MTRLIIIGMVIAVFALAGCVGDRDNQSLRSAYISLSNEVARLKARMTAVEEACLQINTRLVTAEDHRNVSGQPVISKSGPVAASTRDLDHGVLLSESYNKLTRSSFSRHLVGMTVSEALTMLGKPDKVSEDAGIQSWSYSAVRLTTEDGGLEASPALIVFEKGYVSRAVLTEDVKYSSEPEESESGNADVQNNQ